MRYSQGHLQEFKGNLRLETVSRGSRNPLRTRLIFRIISSKVDSEANCHRHTKRSESSKNLFEEFLDEQLSPARVQTPVLGRVTNVSTVNKQRQCLRLVNTAAQIHRDNDTV